LFILRIIRRADGAKSHAGGLYVKSFDPNAIDGQGHVVLCKNPVEAVAFADKESAVHYWEQPSTAKPTRADGKPNRPMTVFTVEIIPLAVDTPKNRSLH